MDSKLLKKQEKLKMGLVLSGGGTKGFSHIGCLKAFEEEGIKFDFVVGTSAGSLVGSAYCAGRTSDEIYDIANEIKERDIIRQKLTISSPATGIEDVSRKALSVLGDGKILFSDLKIPFNCVSVCLNDGKETVWESGDVAKCVSSSCAVPGVFIPVEINGKNYIDGGVLNNFPVDVAFKNNCDIIVGVDISRSVVGTDSIRFFDVLGATIDIILQGNEKYGLLSCDVVIRPSLHTYKAYRLKGKNKMYELGYNVAKEAIPTILDLIKNRRPNKDKAKLKKLMQKRKKMVKQKIESGEL